MKIIEAVSSDDGYSSTEELSSDDVDSFYPKDGEAFSNASNTD